jgi:iron(II)-dependent oxidoreductase
MQDILDRVIDHLSDDHDLSPREYYFHLLAIFHEGMHAEALAYTRQTLGYPAPRFESLPSLSAQEKVEFSGGPCTGDVEIPGGIFTIGAGSDFPFVFDNEKWAHPVKLEAFRIARAPVTTAEFCAFVEDGGYGKTQCWSEEGRRWLDSRGNPQLEKSFAKFFNKNSSAQPQATELTPRRHPVYWQRAANGRWQQRIFDRYVDLNDHQPVMHVSWYEAEAYCNWAGRRLPTEAEWEAAASAEPDRKGGEYAPRHFPWGDDPPAAARANLDWQLPGLAEVGAFAFGDSAFGCRQMLGNVWEWTADAFAPYAGFVVDPYKEYSQPWFGTHKVLRGGCWATRSLLIRNTWRNFYTPDRNDVWAGFRTCAK